MPKSHPIEFSVGTVRERRRSRPGKHLVRCACGDKIRFRPAALATALKRSEPMQDHGPRRTAATSLRSFPRAFIIRPFGEKQVGADGTKIDFQQVEDELIRPAMELAEVAGATTEVYKYSGPI